MLKPPQRTVLSSSKIGRVSVLSRFLLSYFPCAEEAANRIQTQENTVQTLRSRMEELKGECERRRQSEAKFEEEDTKLRARVCMPFVSVFFFVLGLYLCVFCTGFGMPKGGRCACERLADGGID